MDQSPDIVIDPVVRDAYSAPFFDGTALGELRVPRCANGHFMAPVQGYNQPVACCPQCHSFDVQWTPVAGTGVIVAWTVLHSRGGEPRTAGIVELDEGPWLKALIDPDGHELRAGLAVRARFVKSSGDDGEYVPAFRPS